MRQSPWLLVVFSTVCLCSGCGSVIGVLMAPQNVAASAAGNLANNAGSAMQAASPSLDSAGAVSDIDRILNENPNAANRGELLRLKQDLQAQSEGVTASRPPKARFASDIERNDFDRRHHVREPAPQAITPVRGEILELNPKPPGHDLAIDGPRYLGANPDDRHAETKPFHKARASSLDDWQPRIYSVPMSMPAPLSDDVASQRRRQ